MLCFVLAPKLSTLPNHRTVSSIHVVLSFNKTFGGLSLSVRHLPKIHYPHRCASPADVPPPPKKKKLPCTDWWHTRQVLWLGVLLPVSIHSLFRSSKYCHPPLFFLQEPKGEKAEHRTGFPHLKQKTQDFSAWTISPVCPQEVERTSPTTPRILETSSEFQDWWK